jgi:glutamate-1-semialdehyde 2,1-aminomutase
VYQAGTLAGNPIATAAGLAVIDLLDDSAYTMLSGRASELASMLPPVLEEAGVAVQVPVVGPLVGLFFTDRPVTNYDDARASVESGLYARFFTALLDRGVALAPGPYEVLFPSLAHTWNDIERTVDLASAAIASAVRT